MYAIEKVASATSISLESRRECEAIMGKIYGENPAHWPHGLDAGVYDDLYMVRSASTGEPVGFTGWQERRAPGGKKVGYYSIGILPEHRRQGFAKAAVSRLLRSKAAGVDRVEAFVVGGNVASESLAERLGIAVVKAAAAGAAPGIISSAVKAGPSAKLKGLLALVGGGGMAEGMDRASNPGRSFFGDMFSGELDANRTVKGLSNMAAGGLAGWNLPHLGNMMVGKADYLTPGEQFMAGLNVTGAPINAMLTDTLMNVQAPMSKLDDVADKYIDSDGGSAVPSKAKMLLAVLGLAGAGYLGHRGVKALEKRRQGNLRMTLPTKDPNDVETQIEMPIDGDIPLSEHMKWQLKRDTQRRLREEGKERVRRRKKPAALPWATANAEGDTNDEQ